MSGADEIAAGGMTMTEPELHAMPAGSAVLSAQIRAVGHAVRREAVAVALIALGVTGVASATALAAGETISVEDVGGLALLAAIVGLLSPFAVWKGERPFGDSPMWTLPVSHRRHALLKVAAGWGWLMILIGGIVVALLVGVLVTGGPVGADETRLVIDQAAPGGVRPLRWTTPWWQWVSVFTGATVAYLLTSAILLATATPIRWTVGVVVAVVLGTILGEEGGVNWLEGAAEAVIGLLLFSSYGLDAVITGAAESLETQITTAGGEPTVVWRELPTLGRWMRATLAWISLTALALVVASTRRRGR